MLVELTNEELEELEMMWTCNFTILQMQNSIHCEKTMVEGTNEHLNVSENFITNKNSVTDINLCYLYTEWERLVCDVTITKPEELDETMIAFDNAKCWLKVNSKKVKEYQEKVRKLVNKEQIETSDNLEEALFVDILLEKERCELLELIKQHYEKYLTGDKTEVESIKKYNDACTLIFITILTIL